jgi:hypothetical protein
MMPCSCCQGHNPGVINKVGQYGRTCTERILQEAMPAHELFSLLQLQTKIMQKIAIVLHD